MSEPQDPDTAPSDEERECEVARIYNHTGQLISETTTYVGKKDEERSEVYIIPEDFEDDES
jgi:hypothetical protein